MSSRGDAISGYVPAFSGVSGAKIYGENIKEGEVTSAHIASGTVVASDIKDGAITSAKLGLSAVVEEKIAAGAATSAKLGTGAVVEAKLGLSAITSAKIADGEVVEAKMNSFVTGYTLPSAGVAYAVTHGLGAVPATVLISPQLAAGDAVTALSAGVVGEAAASAATSAVFYIIGNKDGIKCRAFALI